MARMKEKIKNLFGFIGRAWIGGLHGKIGVLCAFFAVFIIVRIFFGTVNIQGFVINIWHLNAEQQQLATETENLETLKRHILLLQNYSTDYVEELGLKYLNIGDKNFKVLRI